MSLFSLALAVLLQPCGMKPEIAFTRLKLPFLVDAISVGSSGELLAQRKLDTGDLLYELSRKGSIISEIPLRVGWRLVSSSKPPKFANVVKYFEKGDELVEKSKEISSLLSKMKLTWSAFDHSFAMIDDGQIAFFEYVGFTRSEDLPLVKSSRSSPELTTARQRNKVTLDCLVVCDLKNRRIKRIAYIEKWHGDWLTYCADFGSIAFLRKGDLAANIEGVVHIFDARKSLKR